MRNSYYKLFYHPLEKIFTILWAIWTQQNEVVFKNYKANPTIVFEKAHYIFSYTMLYSININIMSLNVSAGNHLYRPPKTFVKYNWERPPTDWLKWNADTSRVTVTNLSTISTVCKNNKGR